MSEQYKHLRIEKEPLVNDRRTRRMFPPATVREDLRAHGKMLSENLIKAAERARQQFTSEPGSFVLKLKYIGSLDFNHLNVHGVQFVSQEDKFICVAFTDEQGLAKFAEHLAKLGLDDASLTYKQILEALEGINNWTAEDRQSWAVRHKGLPEADSFRLDIELWPIETFTHPDRIQRCQKFEAWLLENKITRIDKINRDSLLMYRVEVTKYQADQLLNHRDVRQVNLPPQSGITYKHLNVDLQNIPLNLPAPGPNSARVCILDSGINSSHPLLKNAIAEGQSYIQGQEHSDDSGHGTAVAGVALYGDLEACLQSNYWNPLFWLYSAKIMYMNAATNETCYDEKTIERIVTEAIEYFATECGCRIFNLSLGNINSPYDGQHIRGLAYVLDTLVRKYNILIIVSAGNFTGSEDPLVPVQSWRDEYPDYLMHQASVIIDPAPALNVITVGSLARHNMHAMEQRSSDIHAQSPAGENQPSPFTRHGPSVRGALKPDLVAIGGNFATPLRSQREWVAEDRGLGVLTLNHEFIGNTLLKEMSGTSMAAPYITHLAGRLLNEYPLASANLLRAILVNHSNLPDECKKTFSEEWCKQYKDDPTTKNRELPREVVGYGKVDEEILYRSTENAVVLMAESNIKNNAHEFYELPLPETFLRSQRAKRELRVTLAFSPPVRTTRLEYTATNITYRLVKGASLGEIQQHFNNDTRDEAEARNDDSTPNRIITSQQRDKGTVQSSLWDLKQLKPSEKWFVVVTRQDRDWGSNLCLEEEPYALIVTVTDKDNLEAQLYTQIQVRIREQERARIN